MLVVILAGVSFNMKILETLPLPPPPEPVFTVIVKVVVSPFVKVILLFVADAVIRKLPVFILPPLPAFRAYEAVKA